MSRVDIAINVHGKPHQTAVTLLSFLRHSGQHVGRIHFTLESRQPFGAAFGTLLQHLGERAQVHKPQFWFGVRPQRTRWLMRFGSYRRSFRYQDAWETSKARYLFITHNDVLYTGDVIGALLGRIEDQVAVGPVGQCWNCPAFFAGHCSPDRFNGYRPTYAEWQQLVREHPGPRAAHYARVVDPKSVWPLPECRINEWSMLVDLHRARPLTMPVGSAVPFGALFGLDIGTQWFHDVLNLGGSVAHVDVAPYAHHAWASTTGGGHAALSDRAVYDAEEVRALEHLVREYPEFAVRMSPSST